MNKTDLEAMSVPELKAYAHENKIDIKGNLSQETLIERILESQINKDDFTAPDLELEPPENFSEIVPERLELQDGTLVDRKALLKAAARDYGHSAQEWNALEDKEKSRKVKGFISTLDLKVEQPEAVSEKQELPEGNEDRIKRVLKRYIDHGLKTEFDDQGLTMVFANKAPIWINSSASDSLLDREARKLVFA